MYLMDEVCRNLILLYFFLTKKNELANQYILQQTIIKKNLLYLPKFNCWMVDTCPKYLKRDDNGCLERIKKVKRYWVSEKKKKFTFSIGQWSHR